MATNQRNNVTLLSSLMFFVLISSSYAITSAELSTICGKTVNPSFCKTFLNSHLSSPNLQALAKTVLGATKTKTTETLTKLQSLSGGGADSKSYKSCLEAFQRAKGNLEEALGHLASGDGQGMNIKVSAVLDGANGCLSHVQKLGSRDALVSSNSQEIKNLCGIALVISNMLPKA